MFAKHNIRNGIFLYVDGETLSEGYKIKNKHRGTLSFDFEDKEEYDKRHDTYKGKEIYIIFDSPTIKTEKTCVKNRMKKDVDLVRSWYTDQYTKVVWLDVDVDLLGEDYVAGLCPNRKTPYCYPMMYQEVSGKVTGVMGGYQSFVDFWPCEKK
ncbi:uncharacterized protein LOC129002062 [Macrosteles quadrilineatus]|uniref:uncharacterized protein LOC129002062 n=1 Tax=Macrosteles quadrilineatus TaxID=74068 RepID=UPI0023E0FF1F|nr:uncharacterized protein LOC129002062 [Macrosteles quadrilineatus]